MSWAEALPATYTDGVLVLHKGKIVYERYFGVTTPQSQHIAFSVTKSFVGTIAASLIAEGVLDPETKVGAILPELAQSGFGDASVQQVMDMTTALDFDETYADGNSGIARHAYAGGIAPRREGYDGPEYVFPAPRGGPFSDAVFRALFERMGRAGLTQHGFRSTFREWAGEVSKHPREVVEHALAHQLADKAEAAYQRGSLLPKRVSLMDDWASYCTR